MVDWCSGMMGWWMVGGGLASLSAIGLVAILVYGVVRWSAGQGRVGPIAPADDAMEIARRRYAAGEISRDAFEELRRDLGTSGR